MKRIVLLTAALALALFVTAAHAEKLSVKVDCKDSVELAKKLKVKVTVKNEESKTASVRQLVHDIRSVYLEIAFKGRTFEFMKIHQNYFDFIFKRQKVNEYLSAVKLGGKKSKSMSFELLLPEAGAYKVRGVYAGGQEIARSEWADVTVKAKGESKRLLVHMKTNKGDMKIAFRPDRALGSVLNFLHLTDDKFYNGVIFHRIIKDFMSQGGDPEGTGSGGPGYYIPQEFNELTHGLGVVSMARTGAHVDTAGCQIFLCVDMSPELTRNLNRQYTVFGKVIEGLDVVKKINAVATDRRTNRPLSEVKIIKAEVIPE